jgi:diaminopimelate decarboxylase
MITSVDQMTAMHKANVESMQALAAKSMAGLEKLAELQMAAAKSTFEDASEQMKALFSKQVEFIAEPGRFFAGPSGILVTQVIGRAFRQPEEGLGFDASPPAHMWRSMIWPNNFL